MFIQFEREKKKKKKKKNSFEVLLIVEANVVYVMFRSVGTILWT